MNSLETNLKFVLDKLGIDPLIRSVEDIHKVQNAVNAAYTPLFKYASVNLITTLSALHMQKIS